MCEASRTAFCRCCNHRRGRCEMNPQENTSRVKRTQWVAARHLPRGTSLNNCVTETEQRHEFQSGSTEMGGIFGNSNEITFLGSAFLLETATVGAFRKHSAPVSVQTPDLVMRRHVLISIDFCGRFLFIRAKSSSNSG
jgi:hypothetical protein